jgi:hypothetical protein
MLSRYCYVLSTGTYQMHMPASHSRHQTQHQNLCEENILQFYSRGKYQLYVPEIKRRTLKAIHVTVRILLNPTQIREFAHLPLKRNNKGNNNVMNTIHAVSVHISFHNENWKLLWQNYNYVKGNKIIIFFTICLKCLPVVKVKISLLQAMEAHRVASS